MSDGKQGGGVCGEDEEDFISDSSAVTAVPPREHEIQAQWGPDWGPSDVFLGEIYLIPLELCGRAEGS